MDKKHQYWKGKKLSEEHKKKIGFAHKGSKRSTETKKKMSNARKGYKASSATKKKISDALTGRKLSKKTKKKIGEIHKGNKYCIGRKASESTKEKIRIVNIGRKHTKETKMKISKSLSGNKASNWKGGITPLLRIIRHHFKYRQWRSDVFTRDDFTCQKCGTRGCYLEAHHIKTFSKIIIENNIKTIEDAINCEELWNINNGITYCRDCHLIYHCKK